MPLSFHRTADSGTWYHPGEKYCPSGGRDRAMERGERKRPAECCCYIMHVPGCIIDIDVDFRQLVVVKHGCFLVAIFVVYRMPRCFLLFLGLHVFPLHLQ